MTSTRSGLIAFTYRPMLLSQLAAAVPGARVLSGGATLIDAVIQDSRQARPGALFVALKGLRVDGHDFAGAAAEKGAAVAGEKVLALPGTVPQLLLPETRWALGELAAELLGRPARRLRVAGVTGTDGKTTVTHLTAHLLNACGLAAGYLSTVGQAGDGAESANASGKTTLEAPQVQDALQTMLAAGKGAAVLEASSHALVQGRVSACDFDAVAVTNVGRDHLEYHRTWADYLRAKGRLIELCASAYRKGVAKTAVLNLADSDSLPYLRGLPIERQVTCAIDAVADVSAHDLRAAPNGTTFWLSVGDRRAGARLPMVGRFNVANALTAAALCRALTGADAETLTAGLASFPGVPGRLEQVRLGRPFAVYVDYAHAAGSLSQVLAELRQITRGRILLVFGSTGRSDHDRPGMGRAAAEGADWFVITTDDPVQEDPAEIARQVESGVSGRRRGSDYEVEPDREAAIRRALSLARAGDAVLLAGKGHEQTMITAEGTLPWSDRAAAEAALRELGY
ncbi:MAG: Mur ligase family protein [Candidatus Dormibacter sp.]|uniref:Mur ligase family protein n=1 Tax=Candidatus Dormibacter sp. TaxID=2973982 RepID=UPI003D9AB6D3